MTKASNVKTSQFKIMADSENESWLIFDIETDGLYHDVTKIHCVVTYELGSGNITRYGPDSVNNAIAHLATADVLIGHNIQFYDIPVINKLYSINLENFARVIDTLVCSRLIWPKEKLYDLDDEHYQEIPSNLKGSNALKAWGHRLSEYKLEFKDFSEYSKEMEDYCVQDVRVTEKLWSHIVSQHYPESSLALEHYFAKAINKQIQTGVPFDVDACLDLVDNLRTKEGEIEQKLKKIFPPLKHSEWFTPKVNNKKRGYEKGVPFEKIRTEEFNPGSRQQIVDRLKTKYEWKPEKVTEKGNPILDDEVLDKLPYPEAKPLAEYMLIKKRLGQISSGNNAWLKLVNNETGRIHGDVITNGTITGRCSHRSPNCGQVPAGYSPYGKECRSLFHAPYDWDLIGIDAKALELRCLAGYLAHWDGGEYAALVINPEVDIHSYNQEQFGVTTRDISKRLLYGMLYGCGAAKAGTIIDPDEKNEGKLKSMGRDAINGFMKGVPALKRLKDQVEETIGSRGYLIGLDKRVLHCRSAFKGLNVLLQSAGAILMKQVVVNIHENIENNLQLPYGGVWEQLLMIHDEVQLTCSKRYTEQIRNEALKAFPQAQEFFNFRCKIEGDSCVGSNWSETH
jgi:hypothetical protein